MTSRLVFALVLASAGFAGCREESSSDVQSLAADVGARNYAVVFTGSTEGIPGVTLDPGNIARVFGPASPYQLGFTMIGDTTPNSAIHGPSDTVFQNATSANLLEVTARVAQQMLAEERQTGKRGTMFWYLSSHGADNGELITNGNGCVYFSQVADAIRRARGGVPLKRLVVFIDVCFAGQTVNGTQAITKQSGQVARACDASGAGGLPAGIGLTGDGDDGFGLTTDERDTRVEIREKLRERADAQALDVPNKTAMLTAGMIAFDAMAVNKSLPLRLASGGTYFGLAGTAKPKPTKTPAPSKTPVPTKPPVVPAVPAVPAPAAATGLLYDELFVGAASAASQTSGDLQGQGGQGTIAYTRAFAALAGNPTATFGQLAQMTIQGAGAGQTPQFNFDPPTLMQETVFGPSPGGRVAPPGTVPPPGTVQPGLPTLPTVPAQPTSVESALAAILQSVMNSNQGQQP